VADQVYDIAVVGGGINGCGIARDAAGRGLSVLLVEMGDLAGATSSASTKLIHGGLRYLEHYELRLVREALAEREVLLAAAPHIIRPLRFVLPHHAGLRPRWMIRTGLWLYDHLGGRRVLPGTRSLRLATDPAGAPLKADYTHGFEYSDCSVDDARLVVLNARDAADRGARILTRTRCARAERAGRVWRLRLRGASGVAEASARILVNASGPWVSEVLRQCVCVETPDRVRLVKGSHIVVDRLFEHERAYIFQNRDGRVCFAIPYEHDFTLIGTTDEDFAGDPATAAITPTETAYLIEAVNAYFRVPVRNDQVRRTFAGVRPLFDDGASKAQEATRDYVLKLDAPAGSAPLLSVFGGKITTYRRLAETVLERLASHLPGARRPWTAAAPLPGGDFPHDGARRLAGDLRSAYPFLDDREARRLVAAYGTRARRMLANARTPSDLGERFGPSLTAAEVRYLIAEEWAATADDVIWRRSKLGLGMTKAEIDLLAAFMVQHRVVAGLGGRDA
jgi:glycerol-3-phosphate dehydrogenase